MRKLVQVWGAVAVIVAVAISVTVPVTIISVAVAIAAVNDFEVGAAAAINPDAVAVVSPSAIEDAIGFAALTDDEHAIAGVSGAEIAVHVIGGAIDEAGGARFPITGDGEIGAAAAVDPYAALA